MRILLLGYGKMGKTIEKVTIERGHEIVLKINSSNHALWNDMGPEKADVAIEFSQPEAAFENIKMCLDKNIPVVSGTTGWLHRKNEIEDYTTAMNGTFFYASNYSIGVNLFFKLNELLARMMDRFKEYDVNMEEIHHTQKKDAPSGTAITLAEGILKNLSAKNSWINNVTADTDAIPIVSIRKNDVPGTHAVRYSSKVDDIEIIHTAHNREGFAKGAVMVAEWIIGRKGILGMGDFLQLE